MKHILSAFTIAQIQTALQIFELTEKSGKTIADVSQYVQDAVQQLGKQKYRRQPEQLRLRRVPERYCPECRKRMEVYRVNNTRCSQVGGNFNVQFLCRACDYDEFDRI